MSQLSPEDVLTALEMLKSIAGSLEKIASAVSSETGWDGVTTHEIKVNQRDFS